MSKRMDCLGDFKGLMIGDKVVLISKKGKEMKGVIDSELSNRGYIDLNEIDVYVDEVDYSITVNVDKYLRDESSLKDFLLVD